MPIAWKALPLEEKLERIRRKIDEMEPLIAEARADVALASQHSNLPKYVKERLNSLDFDLRYALQRLRNGVQSVQGVIPKDTIERERNQTGLKF